MNWKRKKKNSGYLSLKESRRIIRYNVRQMRYYENLKKKKVDESVYITTMKDEGNIVEIEDLHTCFFTDNGTVQSVNGVSFNIPKNKIVGVVGESGCGKERNLSFDHAVGAGAAGTGRRRLYPLQQRRSRR